MHEWASWDFGIFRNCVLNKWAGAILGKNSNISRDIKLVTVSNNEYEVGWDISLSICLTIKRLRFKYSKASPSNNVIIIEPKYPYSYIYVLANKYTSGNNYLVTEEKYLVTGEQKI
jgi:hypothetical protein